MYILAQIRRYVKDALYVLHLGVKHIRIVWCDMLF